MASFGQYRYHVSIYVQDTSFHDQSAIVSFHSHEHPENNAFLSILSQI